MELNLPFSGRRKVALGGFALMILLGVAVATSHAADPSPSAPSSPASPASPSAAVNDEADKAWRDVKKLTSPPMPPAAWQEKQPTQEEVSKFYTDALNKGANAAKDFYTRFPQHPKAGEARQMEYSLLNMAVHRFGDTNDAPRLDAVLKERIKDPNLTEDERLELRVGEIEKLGPDQKAEVGQKARALLKDFPKRDVVYQIAVQILGDLEPEDARALGKEIMANEAAPPQAKQAAEGVLKRMEAVGKPVDIAFTAVDGRAVDVSKMKGKVVLIDFWATWCGPCMGEVPHVKAAYDKLHDKGFEIVGISFDQSKDALNKTLKSKEMTWPQYFDGEGWQNKFGQQFGISSIPQMWLVDKKGNLRDLNAREGLEEKVTKLLAEQ